MQTPGSPKTSADAASASLALAASSAAFFCLANILNSFLEGPCGALAFSFFFFLSTMAKA